jgi:tetratricopeptide (TPR) repeat protein
MEDNEVAPSAITFGTLMNKAETFEQAQEIFARMEDNEVAPSVITFGTLMNKAKTFEQAQGILAEMEAAKISPSVITFNILMNKAGTFELAQEILAKIEAAKASPSVITFNILMNKAGTFEQAQEVFARMEDNKVSPNVITFGTLMNKAETFEQAQEVLARMEDEKVSPSAITFRMLMNKAVTREEGESVLRQMASFGLLPEQIIWTHFFSVDFGTMDIRKLHAWYLEQPNHSGTALEPLIKKLLQEQRNDDAYYLILNYPYLPICRKALKENYLFATQIFAKFMGEQFYQSNIDYALGIANFEIGRIEKAKKFLNKALILAGNTKRRIFIQNLINEINCDNKGD